VVSQGNSLQEKQWDTFFSLAQLHILQNLFSLGLHPSEPLGHLLIILFGQTSHPTPQTPIRAISSSLAMIRFIVVFH
jgi:hypothetical protein